MDGQFGQPGQTTIKTTDEAELLWGGSEGQIQVLRLSKNFSTTLADAGNSPTTVVRRGLLCGVIAASLQAVQWDATASDGSQYVAGVLPVELVSVDRYGVAVNRVAPLFVNAPLKASGLRIKGSALVGHVDEYLARRQLWNLGCRLDDDTQGVLAGAFNRIQTKATNYTVTAADNGSIFHAITANVNFTLPTIKAGLSYEFMRVDGFNLVLTGAANLLVGNNASATSVTFSTAANLIGAGLRADAMYVNGTLKWVMKMLPAPFSTGAFETIAIA